MGVGLTLVVHAGSVQRMQVHLKKHGHDCYEIGKIVRGNGKVQYAGKLQWK